MKKQIVISAAVALSFIPLAAFAGPSVGLGYSDVGLSGHAGRPGVTLTAGNLYRNNVYASGNATFARGFYQVQAKLGKRIGAGGVVFNPFVSMGFIGMNYNQAETGYNTQTVSNYGYSYTYQTPYSFTQADSIQDMYGLAGADMYIPLGSPLVSFEIGGGYGHTLMTFGGNGGAVYSGKAALNFGLAKHVFSALQVSYLHMPCAPAVTEYGAGVAYHF